MSLTLTLTTPPATLTEDETFTIHGLSWEQYVAINDALGDQAGLRTLYLDGSLTFVSPAFVHEWSEDALDKIVLAIVVGCAIDMSVIGSTTLRRGVEVAGLEGDRVYYLGDNATSMAGVAEIDLTIHPPPDLAIEVENSNKADEAMAIHAHLGVPEVWRHDVRRGSLGFWKLEAGGVYAAIPRSLGFPFLEPEDVLGQIERAKLARSATRWFVQLNEWVRDVIRPRLT